MNCCYEFCSAFADDDDDDDDDEIIPRGATAAAATKATTTIMAALNGSSSQSISPSDLAAMLRRSADVVERKEFHPLLYQTMRALTAYAGEYAEGAIATSSSAAGGKAGTGTASAATGGASSGVPPPAPAGTATGTSHPSKARRRDGDGRAGGKAADGGDAPGKKKSAFHDVPDTVLDGPGGSGGKGGAGATAAGGTRFPSPLSAAPPPSSAASQAPHPTPGKGKFTLKGIRKGIEKIGADILGDHERSFAAGGGGGGSDSRGRAGRDGGDASAAALDEDAWCDACFTRGCACKSRRNQQNPNRDAAASGGGEKRPSEGAAGAGGGVKAAASRDSPAGQPQPQQTAPTAPTAQPSSTNVAANNAVNDPEKPAKPCFQRPINPSSNLIANGWIDQQRRSKMRVVWKDVLASLVEGRRPGEETTLWIQRQVVNSQGKVTGLEALHQIPMKWLEDVNYVDLYGDHRFTLKVQNIAEEFYFRTRDEGSAQSWVLTLRSARDASLEGANRMGGGKATAPSAKGVGSQDTMDDGSLGGQGSHDSGPPLAQAGSDSGGDSRPSSSGSQQKQQQSQPQQAQPTSTRMPISELRAIAHGAGYTTRGMERQDLERIAAYVRSGQFNAQKAGAAAGSSSEAGQARQQQEAAAREAAEKREREQRAAAEKREQELAKKAREEEEEARLEAMRREREAAEKRRIEEQMASAKAAAEQRRRQQEELERQAEEIKKKQEEERQRKIAELQAAERARQQQQQHQQAQAAAAAEKKKREEEEQRRRQQQQQQQQQQQARAPTSGGIPTPPTSGGYPQGFQPPQWGQPQQQHQYQQWQQHQQKQQAHFQQQGFPGQQQQANPQHFNQNMPPQWGAYQQQQQQHQQAHFQQQQQQQQQRAQHHQQQQQQPGTGAHIPSKYEEKDSDEEQSAATLQIKRSILINWALQPPNLNALRPIDQLITTIHTAMPPAFGVTAHAYFAKFTPIKQGELVVSAAMGGPDETKLKKAVRKVRVFLHPDKLPRDLNSDQQFMARMLWDITSDSWEEFQKHKEELDWIRS
ncbi:hypothetical protein ACHAWF_015832 [Thalassiosira exigua]